MRHRHVLSIDILRFCAAIAVVYFHLGFSAFARPGDLIFDRLQMVATTDPAPLAAFGWIGVQVFFVISGFVIAYSVQGETLATYARRRILRLVPVVWIVAPFCAVIGSACFGRPATTSIIDLLRTMAFWPMKPWSMGQFWTLPVEIVFYVSVGALIGLRRMDWLEPFGVALALASGVYWVADAAVHFNGHGQAVVQLLLLQHGIYFAIGITLYGVSTAGPTPLRLLVLVGSCIPAFLQIRWAAQWEALGVDPVTRSLVPFLCWLGAISVILVSNPLSARRRHPTFVGVVKLLGMATYPLYLLHYHLGGAVMVVLLARGCSPLTATVVALLISIVAAIVVARFCEPWVRMRLSHLLSWLGLGSAQASLSGLRVQSGSA